MVKSPNLSVLLTTHARQSDLLPLLESLLGFETPRLEIIVVNDAAEPNYAESVRQKLSHHPERLTYLLEHETGQGRGFSLNEALSHVTSNLIWAPLRAERLNEQLLSESVNKFSKDPAAFWLLDYSLPADPDSWLSRLDEGSIPDDSLFVWNRSVLPDGLFYFQPAMKEYHGVELALRASRQRSWQRTDAFFVAPRNPARQPDISTYQEILFSLYRVSQAGKVRKSILSTLSKLEQRTETSQTDLPGLLNRAHKEQKDDPRKALEFVNLYLKSNPESEEAVKLKVTLLEKLRRHVEAAELKHTLQKRQPSTTPQADLFSVSTAEEETAPVGEVPEESTAPDDVELSIVIPTTGNGKPLLEECLVHLSGICNPEQVQLIVIDNASIDDTFDYLQHLSDEKFMNLEIITNSQNCGFGASVNQGFEKSRGKYILIMHNDLFPEEACIAEMLRIIENESELGAVGPLLDRCDNPDQILEPKEDRKSEFEKTNRLDSCCMLLRSSTGVQFDESYGAAFYDDLDLCNQLAGKGFYAAIVNSAYATHLHRETTEAMGLYLEPELEWRNAETYSSKWEGMKEPAKPDFQNPIDSLRNIELPINPLNPSAEWLRNLDELLTDETRTLISNSKWDDEFLFKLTALLMAADQREFLRKTENRITSLAIPKPLLKSLIRFYYRKNIYSRCRHYLDLADGKDLYFDLYRLRIAVAEKELEEAAGLLPELMDAYPCHPELYKLTGDIHHMSGNEGEAKSFYALASQLNPGHVQIDQDAFEIRF
ncbi:MAG: glycosyltransferase [Balneolaceae bacterium]